MSDREGPETGDERFTPPSPYDEPTGEFRRTDNPGSDRDAFYDRHRRRPADLSRVEALDDLDPGEVEAAPASIPAAARRNPAPPPADDDSAAPTRAIPSVSETFPELARQDSDTPPPATAPYRAADDTEGLEAPTAAMPTHASAAGPLPAAPGGLDYHPTAELVDDSTTQYAAAGAAGAAGTDVSDRPPPTSVQATHARRGTLDLGLLLLRVVVGGVAVAHGLQKLFGWWNGPGLNGYEDMLANAANPAIGFDADLVRPLAIVGAISETVGGALLVLGLLAPIGGSAVLAVMLMASAYRMTVAGSVTFFAGGGGIEYEVVLAVAAAGLILTGPGLYSLDYSRGWARRPFLGSAFWLAVGVAAAVAVWILCNGTNPFDSPGNPA